MEEAIPCFDCPALFGNNPKLLFFLFGDALPPFSFIPIDGNFLSTFFYFSFEKLPASSYGLADAGEGNNAKSHESTTKERGGR